MTEIVKHEGQALAAKIEWAKTMAHANLLPREYQNNPGNLLYAIEYADSLGIDRINAITSIHVINGKPTASADLIASLVRKAGHKLRISGDDTRATAQIVRADDPDFTFEAVWDVEKAKSAGLWGKGNWRNCPGAMLRARAITEVARSAASDALYGVIYTPEELGADGPREFSPEPEAQRGVSALAEAADRVLAEPEPTPEPEPAKGAGITKAQTAKLHALVGELGLTREQKLAGASAHAGRTITSTSELTKAEAARVIDALEAKAAKRTVAEIVDAEIVDEPLPLDGE